MNKSASIMELVSNYDAYTAVEELNVAAASDAPATSPVCAWSVAVSYASSWYCASAAASAVSSATYEATC
ncbi:LxmA leader domain family RiPP [Kitasatospora sp. HPMI-4]|uniref:LxmA leader domain family RiPP n=1 Tax=Kitasatospora sp. HPMI-4 TaxID=3448443 RepID=UPI003F1DDE55